MSPPAALRLSLNTMRAPVRCLIYGATTPNKSIALKTNARAKVDWVVKQFRNGKALLKCPPMPSRLNRTMSDATKGSGAVTTDATGAATVKLSTLLPAKVRNAMKPGLYRVTFVARNDTGASPARVILIRVLKQSR